MPINPIAVVGAGAWGTALANVAALAGHEVLLWGRDPAHVAALAATRMNARHLPGIALAGGIVPTASLPQVARAGAVLLVVPAQVVREVGRALAAVLRPGTPVITCAKGIERGTHLFMSEVAAETMPSSVPAVLSGPSFAADVARGLPTAVSLAAPDGELAATLAGALSGPTFRIYHGTDLRGVEIGGAAKNVLAIACGIVVGRRLGESARAALVARGFAELSRFATGFGARPETLMGLAGLGDLVLTCTSPQSRNFAYGEALGRGIAVAEAAAGRLAEGALTAPALVDKARSRGIEMPLAEAVNAVIAGTLTIDAAVEALMNRPIRAESS
jgi:glycerol-3-phosphate dehydrogenase (NAD(P)+)